MNRRARLVVSAAFAATLLAACGMPSPPQQPKAAPPAPGPSQQTGLVPQLPAIPEPKGPKYDAKGRRDPFTVVERLEGSAGMSVASAKLTGIVRGRQTLALVETQDGIGYILKTGDTLFDGRVVEIGSDSIVFTVTVRPGSTSNRVVLRLAAN